MMEFWLIFIGLGLVWLPCALIFGIGREDIKDKIVGSLVCLVLWLVMSLALWGQSVYNAEQWNDGYCDCGQHWELSGVTKTKNGSVTKYYSCPDCYEEIIINN